MFGSCLSIFIAKFEADAVWICGVLDILHYTAIIGALYGDANKIEDDRALLDGMHTIKIAIIYSVNFRFGWSERYTRIAIL